MNALSMTAAFGRSFQMAAIRGSQSMYRIRWEDGSFRQGWERTQSHTRLTAVRHGAILAILSTDTICPLNMTVGSGQTRKVLPIHSLFLPINTGQKQRHRVLQCRPMYPPQVDMPQMAAGTTSSYPTTQQL